MKNTLPQPPYFHSDSQRQISNLLFVLVKDYSSQAEERLSAIKIYQIQLHIPYFSFDYDCSSGTQGVGGNIEVGFNVARSMGRQAGVLFEVDEDRCFGCAACVALCPVNALTLEGLLAIVHEPSCTHCEHCIPACPVHALSLIGDEKTHVYEVLS